MSSKRKGGGQEGALVKMIERQRMQQAADDAAKLEDAISTGPSGSPPAPGISGGGSPGEKMMMPFICSCKTPSQNIFSVGKKSPV